MEKLKVGDRVVINEKGHHLYGVSESNPRNVEGTILYAQTRIITVMWDNGQKNYYLRETLSPALPISLENI